MAKNPPKNNARKGAVKSRSQSLNPKTGLWTKRDTSTGKFMDVKTSGGKFKGVSKEKQFFIQPGLKSQAIFF